IGSIPQSGTNGPLRDEEREARQLGRMRHVCLTACRRDERPGYPARAGTRSDTAGKPASVPKEGRRVERVMGIEPTSSAWEAEVLPLNYTRPAGPVGSPEGARFDSITAGTKGNSLPTAPRMRGWPAEPRSIARRPRLAAGQIGRASWRESVRGEVRRDI